MDGLTIGRTPGDNKDRAALRGKNCNHTAQYTQKIWQHIFQTGCATWTQTVILFEDVLNYIHYSYNHWSRLSKQCITVEPACTRIAPLFLHFDICECHHAHNLRCSFHSHVTRCKNVLYNIIVYNTTSWITWNTAVNFALLLITSYNHSCLKWHEVRIN